MALPTTALFDYPTVEALGYYLAASRVCIMPTLSNSLHDQAITQAHPSPLYQELASG